jgi:hypothetical protein
VTGGRSALAKRLQLAVSDPGAVVRRGWELRGDETVPESLPRWQVRAVLAVVGPMLAYADEVEQADQQLSQSGRSQIDEARDMLARWDRDHGTAALGREQVLADRLRDLLALVDQLAPPGGDHA